MYQNASFIKAEFEHRQTYYPKFKIEKQKKVTKLQKKETALPTCTPVRNEVCCA